MAKTREDEYGIIGKVDLNVTTPCEECVYSAEAACEYCYERLALGEYYPKKTEKNAEDTKG